MIKSDRFPYPLPMMVMAILALLVALGAGLRRLGWSFPPFPPNMLVTHGPLMVCGFLGTVIGVERAVALSALPGSDGKYRWSYLSPLMTGLGALALIISPYHPIGLLLITSGSLGLVFIFIVIVRIETAIYTVVMFLGAVLWFVGNSFWLLGWPVYTIVMWWVGFLLLTIAGERLELSRVKRLSRQVHIYFLVAVGLFLAGLILALFSPDYGNRLIGFGMIASALWLWVYDVARQTVKKPGLTRFIAVCLLSGYVWLGVSGIMGLVFGDVIAGYKYDAMLHSLFLGFVMTMIFAHAPIILPAVLGKAVDFQPVFYTHLILLHLSLVLRVGGDLMGWLPGRQWGGLFNVIAILLFFINTGLAVRRAAVAIKVKST